MRYQITAGDLSNNTVYGNKTYINGVEVKAPTLVTEGQIMSQVNTTDRYFTLVEFYQGSTPRPANISGDSKSWTYTMPTTNNGTLYNSLNFEMSKTKPVITGYSLTTTEINSLKSQGVTRIVVRGSDVSTTTKINVGDAIRILVGFGKKWSIPPAFINDSVRSEFTVSDRWADKTFSDNPSGDSWTSLNIGSIIDSPLYLFTESDIAQFTNSGVTVTNNGANVVVGSPLSIGDNLVAVAGNGRAFYLIADEYGKDKPSIYMDYDNSYGVRHLYFNLSSDNKTATLNIPENVRGSNVNGFVSKTEQKTNVVGTNNVYLINEKILKQVNAKRFKTVSDGGTSQITYDYGQFILSLLNIPFTVPAENIILPESIILSNFDTKVLAPKINVDVLKIKLGDIVVPATNNSLYDYVNTVALLHLPRMDSVAIELEYVVGHTISIEYLLDCYTGDATVNIYSDRIDSPIITKSVNIGVNIPYANTHNTASLDNGDIEVGGDNGVTTAFIELVKVDSVLKDGLFTIPVIDEAILNTATGFIQVEKVELKTSALRNEKEMLINILNNGVIIK